MTTAPLPLFPWGVKEPSARTIRRMAALCLSITYRLTRPLSTKGASSIHTLMGKVSPKGLSSAEEARVGVSC